MTVSSPQSAFASASISSLTLLTFTVTTLKGEKDMLGFKGFRKVGACPIGVLVGNAAVGVGMDVSVRVTEAVASREAIGVSVGATSVSVSVSVAVGDESSVLVAVGDGSSVKVAVAVSVGGSGVGDGNSVGISVGIGDGSSEGDGSCEKTDKMFRKIRSKETPKITKIRAGRFGKRRWSIVERSPSLKERMPTVYFKCN